MIDVEPTTGYLQIIWIGLGGVVVHVRYMERPG